MFSFIVDVLDAFEQLGDEIKDAFDELGDEIKDAFDELLSDDYSPSSVSIDSQYDIEEKTREANKNEKIKLLDQKIGLFYSEYEIPYDDQVTYSKFKEKFANYEPKDIFKLNKSLKKKEKSIHEVKNLIKILEDDDV